MEKPKFSPTNTDKNILKATLFFLTYEKIKRAIRYRNLISKRKARQYNK